MTGARSNVALTTVSAFTATVHCVLCAAAAHASPQPDKTEPAEGAAVRVTDVPCANCSAHELPQLMPAGVLITVPDPLPRSATDRVDGPGGGGGGGGA